MKKFLSSWMLSAWLEKGFLVTSFLVALFAIVALTLWSLVTFYIPFQTFSVETEKIELTNGQTLRVIYPNLVLGDNKSTEMLLILAGNPNGDKASFTIDIPPGLIVKQPKAQEYSAQLEVISSGAGNDLEPEEIKISLVNAKSEHGRDLLIRKSVVITSPQMQDTVTIEIGIETIPWIALQSIVNDPANEKNALILFIASLLSGAGTLVMQYMKTQQDRSREDQEKRKNEFREQWKENPVDTLDGFSRLDRDESEDSEFSMKKKVVATFGWEDKLQQIILEHLKSRNHYFDAKRAAEVLQAVCDVFHPNSRSDNFYHSRSLAPFCELVCKDNRQYHLLTEQEIRCLVTVSKRWNELKPLITDMLHDFTFRRENLPVIFNNFAPIESGQLLRDANIHDIIKDHRRNFPDDRFTTAIFEVLTQDIYWRIWVDKERKLSDKFLRWLFECFAEMVDEDFSLGSEYAEYENRLKQSVLELPVFERIINPDPIILFGGEGMGKTASALWLMDHYTTSTRTDVFPVYAPYDSYESKGELKDWILGKIASALIEFTADNPQKFITSPDPQKIAMGRLMLWYSRNLETLRFKISSSSVTRSTTDIEQVIEFIRKFKPPKTPTKMTKDEMLSFLYLAYPAGFNQICFLWDIRASSPNEDVVNKIKEMAGLVISLSMQSVIVKIFAPLAIRDDVGDLGGIRHAGDLIWGEERLRQLLNRKIKDKFETLWDRSVKDPADTLVRAADSSPRNLVRLLFHLMDHIDGRSIRDGEKLNISVMNELIGSQALKSDDHSRRQNHPVRVNNSDNTVFISYAWGGESERTVNDLERAFTEVGISIVRDKKDLDYKGSILDFEQRIGKGQCVVLIISDKYLRSEHCMHELILVDENQMFRDRIFPIVLTDAAIYKPIDRLQYIRHWDDQIKTLNQALKEIEVVANMEDITSNLGKYVHIRNSFDRLSSLLSDMNALSPDVHSTQGFSTLISSVKKRLETL